MARHQDACTEMEHRLCVSGSEPSGVLLCGDARVAGPADSVMRDSDLTTTVAAFLTKPLVRGASGTGTESDQSGVSHSTTAIRNAITTPDLVQ